MWWGERDSGVQTEREREKTEKERLDIEQRALYGLICQLIHVLCSLASPAVLWSRSERRVIESND